MAQKTAKKTADVLSAALGCFFLLVIRVDMAVLGVGCWMIQKRILLLRCYLGHNTARKPWVTSAPPPFE